MSEVKIVILAIAFMLVAALGFLIHNISRVGLLGGTVHYKYYYGPAYSWEPGYDSWQGFWKGQFSEVDCGTLHLDSVPKRENPAVVDKYISGDKSCKSFITLSEFVYRYSSGIRVEELRLRGERVDEATQIKMFDDWKKQGLLNNVKIKDVAVYDWGNICSLVLFGLIMPLATTFALWFRFKSRGSRALGKL